MSCKQKCLYNSPDILLYPSLSERTREPLCEEEEDDELETASEYSFITTLFLPFKNTLSGHTAQGQNAEVQIGIENVKK